MSHLFILLEMLSLILLDKKTPGRLDAFKKSLEKGKKKMNSSYDVIPFSVNYLSLCFQIYIYIYPDI
jgi:hypothetical protein